MIINTGQRTDIPAFYSQWFMNRVKEGFVLVRNPYNPQSVTRYKILPDVVDLIGFCTKNPSPMLPYIKELDERGFGQFWYFTITPYGKDIEPNVPSKHELLNVFKELSLLVGKDRIGWRYDPVFFNQKYTFDYHVRAFSTMAKELSDYTDFCVISFIDLYPKVTRNFPELNEVSLQEKVELGKRLIQIASENKIAIRTCGEGEILKPYGAICSGCMTPDIYQKASKYKLNFPSFKPSRTECACYLSCDIGGYSSCSHFCRYCYANSNINQIKNNISMHDPKSPFLIGDECADDVIHEAQQKSWKYSPEQQFELNF